MKIQMPGVTVEAVRVESISVGQVTFAGNVTATNAAVTNAHVTLAPGPIRLEGFTVELSLSIEYLIGPFDDTFNTDTIRTLSPPDLTLSTPPLPPLKLTVGQASIPDLTTRLDRISGMKLGPVDTTHIRAEKVTAPSAGFQISGLSLESAALAGLGLPAADIANAVIGRVTGEASIPQLVINGITLPAGAGGDLDLSAEDIHPVFPAMKVELLNTKLSITPNLTIKIERLILPNVVVGLSIEKIVLDQLHAAFSAAVINASNIKATRAAVPEVKVGP